MHLGNGQWTPMCTVHLLGAISVGVGIGLRLARRNPAARKISYAARGAVISVTAAYVLSIGIAELIEHVLLGAHVQVIQWLLDSEVIRWAEGPVAFGLTLLVAIGLWGWAFAEAISCPTSGKRASHAAAN